MKKCVVVLLCLLLIGPSIFPVAFAQGYQGLDWDGFNASLSDWILGSNWGIVSGTLDPATRSVTLTLPPKSLAALSEQDRTDIQNALRDMVEAYLPREEPRGDLRILYVATGEASGADTQDTLTDSVTLPGGDAPETAPPDFQLDAESGETARANLVFIHHSVGENWLREGLTHLLNERGYHVADITYGWREYGDHTDTGDWPQWFTDEVMGLVYREQGAMSAENNILPAAGENRIILFKSCFPNSDVGNAIEDEMALYKSLLPYFESRPDKMFVLVTPPPMIRLKTPGLTRRLCTWLADRENGWLSNVATNNVFAFDLYNVLTHPDAHHRLENGQEVHASVQGADTLYYDWDGDDHPNPEGSRKAAEEIAPLLDAWYLVFMRGVE